MKGRFDAFTAKSRLSGCDNIADVPNLSFTANMNALESLLRKYEAQSRARWWVGSKPDARDGKIAEIIAGQIMLPDTGQMPFSLDSLVVLGRSEAAHVLAVAGTTSLAYGTASPRASAIKAAKDALADLADNASFLGNGTWKAAPSMSWTPLTSATFECGIIGFDDKNAFVFWVEEED